MGHDEEAKQERDQPTLCQGGQAPPDKGRDQGGERHEPGVERSREEARDEEKGEDIPGLVRAPGGESSVGVVSKFNIPLQVLYEYRGKEIRPPPQGPHY